MEWGDATVMRRCFAVRRGDIDFHSETKGAYALPMPSFRHPAGAANG